MVQPFLHNCNSFCALQDCKKKLLVSVLFIKMDQIQYFRSNKNPKIQPYLPFQVNRPEKCVVDAMYRIILLLLLPNCTRGLGAKMTGQATHVWVPVLLSLVAGLF
jgi:hypothetical protein